MKTKLLITLFCLCGYLTFGLTLPPIEDLNAAVLVHTCPNSPREMYAVNRMILNRVNSSKNPKIVILLTSPEWKEITPFNYKEYITKAKQSPMWIYAINISMRKNNPDNIRGNLHYTLIKDSAGKTFINPVVIGNKIFNNGTSYFINK